jgi:hypothetical protein
MRSWIGRLSTTTQSKARRLDLGLARGDGLARPDLAIGDFVQRGDDAGRPGLGDLGQVMRSKGPYQRQLSIMQTTPRRAARPFAEGP